MARAHRPRLKRVRKLWRDERSMLIGLDPVRGAELSNLNSELARLLFGLDGTRTEEEVLADAAAVGLDVGTVTRLLEELRVRHLLADGYPVSLAGAGNFDTAERLAPDHASLELLEPGDHAADVLARRKLRSVVVHGAGRLGTPLASLLAAANIGHVRVVASGNVRLADCAPGGVRPTDRGTLRTRAAAGVLRQYAPEVETGPLGPGRVPDLVVITDGPPDPGAESALLLARIPHLLVAVSETSAIIGPLVLPGKTSCLQCADLARTDRDDAWPNIAGQLAVPRDSANDPCDVVLALFAAAMGAMQCLTFLDGRMPRSSGATLKLALPDWQMEYCEWPLHHWCDCWELGFEESC